MSDKHPHACRCASCAAQPVIDSFSADFAALKRGAAFAGIELEGSAASMRAQQARHDRELEQLELEQLERVLNDVHLTSEPFIPDAVFVQERRGLRRVDFDRPFTPELAPDPFYRIDLAAAAWRNAYRAYERRDREAVERYLREAVDHGIALIRGLYG